MHVMYKEVGDSPPQRRTINTERSGPKTRGGQTSDTRLVGVRTTHQRSLDPRVLGGRTPKAIGEGGVVVVVVVPVAVAVNVVATVFGMDWGKVIGAPEVRMRSASESGKWNRVLLDSMDEIAEVGPGKCTGEPQ